MSNHFQGTDGFIWWHGVVEDRKDPLFLGRCRVRILGWHTANKTELPTQGLPWAYPVMPITSASQTNAGEAPVGPVEGTWVMGYYRDGELAQEPVMMGTLPGIPENYAKQNTGFNDPRLDEIDTDKQTISRTGATTPGGGSASLTGWPYPPKTYMATAGKEVTITEYTNEERLALVGKSLYPRLKNEPTTSRYARGAADDSSKVETEGIFAKKNANLQRGMITSSYIASINLVNNIPSTTRAPIAKIINTDLFTVNLSESINQPPSPYAAVYPFNHAYESESGHLVEIDDTPTKERLHWYHRSGTFTEFHPKGIRTDFVTGHHYHIVHGNAESIIRGKQKRVIEGDSFTNYKSKYQELANDFVVTADNGDIILGAAAGHSVISGIHVILDGKQTVMSSAPTLIRTGDSLRDIAKGSYTSSISGGYDLQAGSLTLGTMGGMNVTVFGNESKTIGGSSEEVVSNLLSYPLGSIYGKTIKTLMGGIALEAFNPLTGGISLNHGPLGLVSQISITPITGGIKLLTTLAPEGISLMAGPGAPVPSPAVTMLSLIAGLMSTTAQTVSTVATTLVDIKSPMITLGAGIEPALLGASFAELFTSHQHPTSVGPTGPIMPQYATKVLKTMAKSVFLS